MKSTLKISHKFIHGFLRFTLNLAKLLWKISHSSMIFPSGAFPLKKPMELHRCRAMVAMAARVRSQSFRDAGEAFNVRAPRFDGSKGLKFPKMFYG